MKTTKKVLSIVIALAFILSAFPMPVAFAEGEEYVAIALDTPVVVTATEENLGVEIFKFVAEKGGRYNFFSSDNDFDTYGEVYDKDMNLIAENDDGSNGLNFEVAFVAAAGATYYLKARGLNEQISGDFSVVLEKIPGVESVSIDKENVTGKPFDTQSLNLTAYPEDMNVFSVEWASNDESVVKIKSTYNGDMSADIKLVGGGTTTVVATVDGHITATCTVTVEELSYEQFMPEQTKGITATEDNSGEAIYKFVPEESGNYKFYSHDSDFDTYGHIYDSELNEIYYDDDDGDGNNFYIEFDAVAGEVYYLKARPYSPKTSGQYSVSVNKLVSATSMELSAESISGKVGSVWDVTVSFIPENAKEEQITWSSSDEAVVKFIYIDNNDCQLQLVGTGTATVTATSENGLTDSCAITVDSPVTIAVDEAVQLECSDNEYNETYLFVPQATGIYRFNESIDGASYSLNLYNDNFEYISGYSGMQVELTAGETYYYTVNAEKSEDAEFIDFSLVINHLVPATGITLSATEIKGLIATYETITAQLLPENAIEEEITWISSNEDAVVIYDTWDNGKNCEVKIVGKGSSVLTATTKSGFTASCTVTADQIVDIAVGEVHTRYEDDGYEYTYMFEPEETGTYKFDFTCVNSYIDWIAMYDGDLSWLSETSGDFQYEFTAGETYYLNPYAYVDYNQDEGDESYISLKVSKSVSATSISLSEDDIKGCLASYETITATFSPENAKEEDITWTSSDDSVVVIDRTLNNSKTCKVKFVGGGTATITATSESGLTDTCLVTVEKPLEISLDEVITRTEEEGYLYTYTFTPEENGVYLFDFSYVNSNIWCIDAYDSEFSYLEELWGDFQIELAGEETYYFFVSGESDYMEEEGDESYISLTVSKLVPAESLVLSEESVTKKIGKSFVLTSSWNPEKAIDEDITWESSDESVAVIDDIWNNSKSCEIYFVGTGTATITATSENGLKDTCTVTVVDVPEIALGETELITDENGSYSRNVNYYKFIPEESGIYKFSISGENTYEEYVSVWDNNRDINASDFTSIQETLVAGETYYCEASAPIDDYDYESSATLTIEKLVPPASIVLNKESYTGALTQFIVIKASFLPEGCASEYINWSSTDESVAEIYDWWDDGCCRVFLSGTGIATITAESDSGLTKTCTITVNEPSEISLNEEKTLSTDTDGMATGSYKFVPEEDGVYAFYSYDNDYDTYGYVYNSEGNEVVASDDDGDNNNFFATFEATAGETYYFSARPFSRNAQGEYSVSVKKFIKATSISFKEQSVTSRIGSTEDLYVVFGPEGAVPEDLEFSSSDESVVMVLNGFDGDEGKGCCVSFIKVGTATITATTDSGLTATCTVTVEDVPEITLGETALILGENNYYSSVDNYFKFIPEEDGTYRFTVSGENIFDENVYLWNDEFSVEAYSSYSLDLTAGQTCYVKAYADVDDISAESSAVITVEKLKAPTSLTLNPEKTTGIISDEITVDVVFGPEGSATEDFNWEISDENVLEAVSGDDTFVNFFAIGAGEATVTITSESGLTASCTITIAEPTEISLDEGKEISTDINSGVQVFKFIPEEDGIYGFYSFDNDFDTYGYVYDSDVCEINRNDDGEENNNFLVQFEAVAGEVYYLRARPFDNEEEGTCYVSVKKLVEPTILRLSKMSYSGIVLDELELYATISPENAYEEEIFWRTSNENVAQIDYYEETYARIKLIGRGNAIITATTEGGLKATCTIISAEPEEITLEKGKSASFKDGYCSGVVKFVPEEDGVYRFDLSKSVDNGSCTLFNAEDMGSSLDEIGTREFKLTAGETYYFSYSFWDNDTSDDEVLSFGVSKCNDATSMALSQATLSAVITENFVLQALFGPGGAASEAVEWTISDESVVGLVKTSANNAEFKAIGIGTATITATSESGMEATCVVNCLDAPLLEADTESELSFNTDEGHVIYKFVPEVTATYRIFSTQSNLSYSYICVCDSDLEWAVDEYTNGADFNLGFNAVAGNAYYISVYVGSYEDTTSCKFKITQQTAATSLSLSADTINGSKFGSAYCEYEISPAGAAREEVTWTSSNPAVVKVDNGYIYFDSIGVATVTVKTQSGLSDSVTVTVSEPPALELGVLKLIENTHHRDTVVHSFIPETSGCYTFSSSSDGDPYADLCNDEFEVITSNDDGGDGYNFRITSYLEAGKVYYLASRRYSSSAADYSILVTKAPEGDINDDGVVDVYDYQQLVNFTVLTTDDIKEEYGTNTFAVADMNNDGAVDALDAWKLALIINN